MEIESNVVYEHLLESKKKIIVEQGGTRSGKTLQYTSLDYL